ncbi:MAG: ATP-binding cassette domain-containing protein [Rubritalea sp.]|uniref:ABC transporter ATP-binding protein n=1 Tax=Rubritalea sp. TaxID=2109375 RepID=UPI0032425172
MYSIKNLRIKRQSGDVSFELSVPEFNVGAGEFVGIVGDSGCGKSTLLDILGLILKPDESDEFSLTLRSGEDFQLAENAQSESVQIRRKHMGYVLQTGGLLEFLKVYQNIAMPLNMNGVNGSTKEKVLGIANKLGISKQLKKYPKNISGGERQRAAIARAVIHHPEIILADEPTAALDPERAVKLVHMFKELCDDERKSSAVVMVSHDRNLVESIADRIYSFNTNTVGNSIVSTCCEKLKNE